MCEIQVRLCVNDKRLLIASYHLNAKELREIFKKMKAKFTKIPVIHRAIEEKVCIATVKQFLITFILR